jgi:outer membrane lipoprotein-sorting protein
MKTNKIRQTALILILIFISASFANADTYIKQTRRTDPFTIMGQTQPEKIETTVTWLGKDRARIDMNAETSMIILPDKKFMYVLNHQEKTYTQMPLNMQETINTMITDEGGEEAKRAAEMYRNMSQAMMQGMAVKVTPTSETKKIKNWNTQKYLIEMNMPMAGTSKSEAWATEDIKVDPRLYWTAANAAMAGQQGFDKVLQEMQKVKGFIVFQEIRSQAMGAELKVTEEVVELAEKSAPKGAFDIPAGYKKAEGFMQ